MAKHFPDSISCKEGGAAFIEFALVSPLIFGLILFSIEATQLVIQYGALRQSLQNVVRFTAALPDGDCGNQARLKLNDELSRQRIGENIRIRLSGTTVGDEVKGELLMNADIELSCKICRLILGRSPTVPLTVKTSVPLERQTYCDEWEESSLE